MTTEPCVTCGNNKQLVHTEPNAVTWLCALCGYTREEATP